MKNRALLRQVINKINKINNSIDFNDSQERHLLRVTLGSEQRFVYSLTE